MKLTVTDRDNYTEIVEILSVSRSNKNPPRLKVKWKGQNAVIELDNCFDEELLKNRKCRYADAYLIQNKQVSYITIQLVE